MYDWIHEKIDQSSSNPHTNRAATSHPVSPCRVVKITIGAVLSIGDVFKCIISAIASKEMGTVHLLTPVPRGSVSTNQLPTMRVEGKKTHVMVM